jgi:predicted RNA-binding protein YlxR (DUF448 family)
MVKNKKLRKKHIPQRTCIACRMIRAKKDLIRVVNSRDDGVNVDLTGKMNGRGAYICAQRSCWDKALTAGSLHRALRVTLSAEDSLRLQAFAETLPDLDA